MMRRFLITCVLAATACFVVTAARAQGGRLDFAPSEYFVGLRGGISDENVAALKGLGATIKSKYSGIRAVGIRAYDAAAQAIARNPRVKYVERVPMRYALGLEDEQLAPALNNGLYGLITTRAVEAHSRGVNGSGINVGVADTGVDYYHPDIAPNYRGGTDTIYMDDDPIFEISEDEWGYLAAETHGTHVAGTILAANNTVGVLGAAPSANLYHARVLDAYGGTSETVMNGVRWLVENANCKIVNLSLGGGTPSITEQAFYEEMRNRGALIVCAAGNDGANSLSYPAAYPTNIAVGAVDVSSARASWSNTGTDLDVSAPGVNVLSSVPDSWGMNDCSVRTTQTFSSLPLEGSPKTKGVTGTIVDCGRGLAGQFPPSVAGNIALVQRGDITFTDKVNNAYFAGATAVIIYNNAPGNFSGWLGSGWLLPTVSVSDTDGAILVGQAGSTGTVRNWNFGWDIYSGTSMATPHVSGALALAWSVNPSASNAFIENCLLSTCRDLGATGYDTLFGHGLIDASAAVTAAGSAAPPPPGAPANLTATPGNEQVSLSWTGSDAASYYSVKRSAVSGGPYEVIGQTTATGFTHSGLTNGVTYFYVVSATNAGGTSPDSNEVSAIPNGPLTPAAPTNLTATAGKRKVTLQWTQSASVDVVQNRIYRSTTNGGPYTLIATISAGTSFDNTSLASRVTYYYVVTAVSSAGKESAYSNQASAKTR